MWNAPVHIIDMIDIIDIIDIIDRIDILLTRAPVTRFPSPHHTPLAPTHTHFNVSKGQRGHRGKGERLLTKGAIKPVCNGSSIFGEIRSKTPIFYRQPKNNLYGKCVQMGTRFSRVSQAHFPHIHYVSKSLRNTGGLCGPGGEKPGKHGKHTGPRWPWGRETWETY